MPDPQEAPDSPAVPASQAAPARPVPRDLPALRARPETTASPDNRDRPDSRDRPARRESAPSTVPSTAECSSRTEPADAKRQQQRPRPIRQNRHNNFTAFFNLKTSVKTARFFVVKNFHKSYCLAGTYGLQQNRPNFSANLPPPPIPSIVTAQALKSTAIFNCLYYFLSVLCQFSPKSRNKSFL